MTDDMKHYRKRGLQPMRPHVPGEDLTGASVQKEDTPELGGMIAWNPANPKDRWYVAKQFFEDNYVEANQNEAGATMTDQATPTKATVTDEVGLLLDGEFPRGTTAVPCACGGYADKVDATDDEDDRYGCGRLGCCLGAFKCRLCGKRLLARFPAPEME